MLDSSGRVPMLGGLATIPVMLGRMLTASVRIGRQVARTGRRRRTVVVVMLVVMPSGSVAGGPFATVFLEVVLVRRSSVVVRVRFGRAVTVLPSVASAVTAGCSKSGCRQQQRCGAWQRHRCHRVKPAA